MREDIQALRAFAVIAVLLFHVDLPFAAGGYLGVDIFFVISGYVITGLIQRELASREFSFRRFYLKRVCRILPASTATIALTLVAGGCLLTTNDMKYLGASSVAALASLSNVHFWQESGYFDEASHLKPLLHTWSLAVEEQFYLAWPALVVFAYRRNWLAPAIILLAILSLVAAQFLLERLPDAVFFLMPFRAFEFCAGAILHFLPAIKRPAVFYAGTLIMVGSVAFLDSSYPMPGLLSLVPVAGAMACICAGQAPGWRMPAWIVGIGNASYSIYLAHWPPIVFYKYVYGSHLQLTEQILLLVVSILLGFVLNRAIERPMRPLEFWRGRGPRVAGLTLFTGVALVSSTAWGSNGWSWRVPSEIRNATSKVGAYRAAWTDFMELHGQEHFKPNGKKILIIGDSHGQDLFNAIYQNDGSNVIRLNVAYRCQPVGGERPVEIGNQTLVITSLAQAKGCARSVDKVLRDPRIREADVVILSARWKEWAIGRVPAVIALLQRQTKAPILVFGPQAEFEPIVPRIVEGHGQLAGLDAKAARSEDRSRRALGRKLKALVDSSSALYVDKFALLCKADPCPVMVPDGAELFIWDYGHWSVAGARYFGLQLKADPVLAKVIFSEGQTRSKPQGVDNNRP